MPQKVSFLLSEVEIRFVDGEFELGRVCDENSFPFAHLVSAPASHGIVVDRKSVVGDDKPLVYTEHFSETAACGTRADRIVEVKHHVGRSFETDTVGLEDF